MKSRRCFPNLRPSRLMATLILFLIFAPGIFSKTIVINIQGKQYVPPARTPLIPLDLIDKGVRFAVRVGDTIKICNTMQFIAKPFSLSVGNAFNAGLGTGPNLIPGQCMTVVVHEPGGDGTLKLFDELHAKV